MSTVSSSIRERLSWTATPEQYQAIRRLWIQHSKAEDARDLDGLIATLTEDCVYENVPTGQIWKGHAGARAFYTGFLGAFPDVRFDLTDIVIGPQGVIEIATMTGTHRAAWAGVEASGKEIRTQIIIHFPWDPAAGKFTGERIYFDRADFNAQLASETS